MSDVACAFCGAPATQTCANCNRPYCEQHGTEACMECMAPDAALPPARIYLGALAALIAATVVGIFLFISPPSEASRADEPREVTQPASNLPTATPTPSPSGSPTEADDDETPGADETPTPGDDETPSDDATATATEGPEGTETYTVVSGDTLSGIAAQFDITVEELVELNPGLDPDGSLQIGQEMLVPSGDGE